MQPLPTRDPVSGGELIVTRLESAAGDVVIEGRFSLGWLAQLTPEQLEFVRLLALHRGNVQRTAAALRIAYNTARARLDEIAAALRAPTLADRRARRLAILDQLDAGDLSFEAALRLLREDAGRQAR
jgi:hypothetical protein